MSVIMYRVIGIIICLIILILYIYRANIEPFGNMNLSMISTQLDYYLVNYFILSSYNSCIETVSLDGTTTLSLQTLTNTLSDGFRFLDFELYVSNDNKSIPIVASSNTTVSSDGNVPEPIINTTTPLSFANVMNHLIYNAFRPGICSNYTDPLIIHLRIKTYDYTIYDKLANILKIYNKWLLPSMYSYKSLMSKKPNNPDTATILNTPLLNFKNKIIILTSSVNDAYLDTSLNQYINNIPFNQGVTTTPIIQITPIVKLTINDQLTNFNKFNLSILTPYTNEKTNIDMERLQIPNKDSNIDSLNPLGIQCICVMKYKQDVNYNKYIKWFNDHKGAYVLKDKSLRVDPVIFVPKPQDEKLSFKPVTFKVAGVNQPLDI